MRIRERVKLLYDFAGIYIRPRWGTFSIVQMLHVVAFGLLLAPPLLIRHIIDVAVPAGNMTQVVIDALAIAGVAIVFTILAATKEYWGHEVAQRITSRLRNDLYGHFQKLSMNFHDRRRTGGLLSRIVDDMNVVQEVLHHGPEALILAAVMVFGVTGLLLYLEWRLAIVALAILPPLVLFTRHTGGRMWERFRDVRDRKESLSDRLEENLAGIHIIKSFVAEERTHRMVEDENAHHYRSRMAVIRYMCRLFPGALLLKSLGLAAVAMYGGYLVIQGSLGVGGLTAFVLYLNYFTHPIMRIVQLAEQGGRFFASLERFSDFMNIRPDIRDREDAVEMRNPVGEVVFEEVHFRYEQTPVLQGVSFVARPGQMVALVGPSGAGKTTISRLIPRFYEPQTGRVLIDGKDVRDYTLRSLRAHIGAVMQDDYLFSGSVAMNIAYARPDATRDEIEQAAGLANAVEFIEQLPEGYDTEIGKRGVKLSEGQRQRISIARALLKDPQILLLDEATSSVDAETELLIQKAIDRLRAGRTTFAIAHRLSTIFAADQILFIDHGTVVERGKHEDLIAADGPYARFFGIQFREVANT